jgi:very-short-patch-repair endonuclease
MKTRPIDRNMFYGANGNIFEIATLLRKRMTLPELILWSRLRDRKLFKVKFRRQHPISNFIVDFYCHELKLVIEIDGEVHQDKNAIEYDLGREADLKKYGITILRFSNDQVKFNLDYVKEIISDTIRSLSPP